MADQSLTIENLYTEYIAMRQRGAVKDDAVHALRPKAERLSGSDRQKLGQLILNWEAAEGQSYNPLTADDPRPTKPVIVRRMMQTQKVPQIPTPQPPQAPQ